MTASAAVGGIGVAIRVQDLYVNRLQIYNTILNEILASLSLLGKILTFLNKQNNYAFYEKR